MNTQDDVADEMGMNMEAYSRARAFFMTLAFYHDFGPFFLQISGFSLVHMTVVQRCPPLSFFATAWRL